LSWHNHENHKGGINMKHIWYAQAIGFRE